MNWDALSAMSELVGAIAVIVSIIYLAAQVRQTRVQLQAQAEDNITSRAFEAFSPVYEGKNASIFRKGLESPELLSEDEAFVFSLLMDRQRGAFATIVRRSYDKSISKEVSERLLDVYRGLFLQTEGGKVWLKKTKHLMSKEELLTLDRGT